MILRPQSPVEAGIANLPLVEMSYIEAISRSLQKEMRKDPRVLLMGEMGIGNGTPGVAKSLFAEFGEGRIRDLSLSECTIANYAIRVALEGMRPVVEFQFSDFISIVVDQIISQGTRLGFTFGGETSVPVVFRTLLDAATELSAQHIQCLEAWLMYIPGLNIVLPSTPADAWGLLCSALLDAEPTVFLEHKMLYQRRDRVPVGDWRVPLGRAQVRREGHDLTIIALSIMVERALAVAERLAEEGIEAEVIDPRTLRPLDEATLVASICKTRRVLIVHETAQMGGFGGEIAARIAAGKGFSTLEAPIMQLGAMEMLMPYFASQSIPQEEEIYRAAHLLLR
ncbi:MAG TPA: transketolase C-terminal domain-containing protein [Ktedonosporobacter sp.]|jgi:pyruvate dehydrogenase E1 component beta subunit|nr:transketolase C-terminal domain-containing protein [Ktedonosporobacter sp.]